MKTDFNVALILDIAACRASAAPASRAPTARPVLRSLSRRVRAMMRLACRVLGLKRRKGLGLALLGAAVTAGAPAHAANGIHINASTTGDCVGINAPTASGQAGSINYMDRSNSCNGNNAATQKDSVLFFRPAGVSGTGATSLSLGGDLYVNSGFIRLGDTNSVGMRIGDATTKAEPLALAIGNNANAGSGGLSIGRSSSTAGGSFAVAIGDSAKSTGSYSVAFGANSVSEKDRTVALGAEAKATEDGGVAIGTKSQATGINALAAGAGAVAIGANSVAIGAGAQASQGLSVALGSGATTRAATAPPLVVLNGKTYVFDSTNLQGVVSVGSDQEGKKLTRQVINVAPAVISATSFDAVNGAQLFATNDAINELGKVDKTLQAAVDRNTVEVATTRASQAAAAESVAQSIGGGTRVDEHGRIVMPAITLGSLGQGGGTQPTTLLGAVGALDSTVKRLDSALNDVLDVAQDAQGLAAKAERQLEGLGPDERVVDRIDEVKQNALLWDPTQKTYSATHGGDAQNRISNVAAGVAQTDAVNKGQLDGVAQEAANAQQAAAAAQRSADAAQGAATGAQQASAAAQETATEAKQVADAARGTAAEAQRKADAADAKLAGIGDGETVAGRIEQAVQAAADKADRNAGASLAAALGGGSVVGADGKASAPAYAVSQVNGDGAVTAPAPATTVGAAVAALDANVLKVNERVSAQGNDLNVLKQDMADLRDDSLLWDQGAGAFSAAHDGAAPNRIVNVAAGQAETDAVNKGQLDTVAQAATAAQTAAGQAKAVAESAQGAANGAAQMANEAQAGATAARTTANEAKRTADAAQTAATQAGDAATGAGQAAQAAQADAARAQDVAQAAQAAATGADQAAARAQSSADAAQATAVNAQQTAQEARQQAGQAQAAASSAQKTADANNAKLAGIGEGETVAGRIDAAATAAREAAAREAGQSLAAALGGGVVVGADGKPGAPAYAVSQVGADGAVAPQGQTASTVGAAVAALDANVLKVNDRVRAQGDALSTLTQDLEGLRDDSLLWDQEAGAFSATRGGEPANRIVNLAAGQATTDAVNKGQLDEAVAQLKAQGAGLLQEADGQLQVGRGADATVVNLAGAAPQRDAQGNPVMDADGNVVTAATDRTLTGVADGKAANDAVNKGQLDTVAGTATAASEAAAGAQQTANAAQDDAENARQVATAAQATARDAAQSASAAQGTATQARQSADAASAKLAGIGDGETVASRIDQASKAAAGAAVQDAGKALAAALGGGAGMDSDGNPVAPAYVLNQIGPDGSVKAGGQTKNNVGDALAAVDANVLAVNERVATQGRDVTRLTQDVSDLRNDSLLWDQDAGAFSAAHGADAPNRIANVAAGQAATDAVNKGQLDTVSQAADVARADARQARDSADAAQGTALQAQQGAQSAQGAAANAQGAADAANAKLGGIGEGETVVGRIGDATRAASQALADALGGGADVRADGTAQGPAFAVTAVGPDGRGQASTQGNVADALRVVDGSVVAVNDKVNAVGAGVDTMREQLDAGQLGLVRQDAGTRQITVAGQTDGARVTFSGTGGARTLDGVKAGAVSQASSEVVVGSQLFSVNQDLLRNSEAVGDLEALTGRQGVALTALSDRVDSGNVGLTRHDPSSNTVSVAADRGGQVVDLAGTDGARQVTGLRDGRIQAGSTDAVTGGQVNTLAERVDRLDAQGTSVAIDNQGDGSDRAVVAPGSRAVAVGSNARATGANAVATGAGADARGAGSAAMGAGAQAQASGSVAVGANAAATAPGSVALGEGAQATRANTVSVGTAGAERQITNVAAATHDTDAVNLQQATGISRQEAGRALEQANQYTDRKISQLRSEANAGIASAMAMAALPSASSAGKSMLSMGTSLYNGQSAIAMGISGRSANGAWAYRASSSSTKDGDIGAAVGVGYEW